jgi:two-component system NarL family sensor kinase
MGARDHILPIASDHLTGCIALAVSLIVSVLLIRTPLHTRAVVVASLLASLLATLIGWRARRARLRALLKRELDRTLAEFADAQRKLERERIARELHDGVCSTLLASRSWLEQAVQLNGAQGDWAMPCSRGLAELQSALTEIRRISNGLEPALLGSRGFVDTLRHMSHEFSERARIEVRVLGATPELNQQLAPTCQAALVRITQETFANIERHSAANRVVLELCASEESLTLTITDDGHVFCPLVDRNVGVKVGLSNMRERLAEVGGILTLRFAPQSTEIIAQVPMVRTSPVPRQNPEQHFTGASLWTSN